MQAGGERSKTVILVKNLRSMPQETELREVFGKYGPLVRVLLPPHGITAIVEFQSLSEARMAFRKLVYRQVGDDHAGMFRSTW